MMIALRRAHPVLRRRTFFSGERAGQPPEILWHGVEPSRPDFGPDSRALAFALDGRRTDRPSVIDRDIYVAFNAWRETAGIPDPRGTVGPAVASSASTRPSLSPEDIIEEDQGPRIPVLQGYPVRGHSMIILISEAGP